MSILDDLAHVLDLVRDHPGGIEHHYRREIRFLNRLRDHHLTVARDPTPVPYDPDDIATPDDLRTLADWCHLRAEHLQTVIETNPGLPSTGRRVVNRMMHIRIAAALRRYADALST